MEHTLLEMGAFSRRTKSRAMKRVKDWSLKRDGIGFQSHTHCTFKASNVKLIAVCAYHSFI